MVPKRAINTEEAFRIQEKYDDQPHGWIQWKGTNVCMDVWCKCGHHSHVDADFAYIVKCPECGTVFSCNGHIELIEVEKLDPDHDHEAIVGEKTTIDHLIEVGNFIDASLVTAKEFSMLHRLKDFIANKIETIKRNGTIKH